MSVNALEKALWQIYQRPSEAERYNADPAAFAREYRLDAGEQEDLVSLDVMGMQKRGANPLLVMMVYQTVKGVQCLPQYFGIVNQ